MPANQNVTQLQQQTGSANTTSLFYAVVNGSLDTGLPMSVFVNNLGLTGIPTTPTAAVSTNTVQIASCAFVLNQYASPPALGGTTPNTGAFTTLTCTSLTATTVVLSGGSINGTTVGASTPSSGAFTTLSTTGAASLASVTCNVVTFTGGSINGTTVGATTASTGAFTTLSASSTVSGTGFSTYLASPPAIGGTTAAAGSFTTLNSTGGALNGSIGATTPNTGSFTTVAASGLISPTSTVGIKGTTAADNAQAGSIGEFISSNVPSGSAVSLTTGTAANVTSISLTAGDWDVSGNVWLSPNASTTSTFSGGWISTSSAALPTEPNSGASAFFPFTINASNGAWGFPVGTIRINVSTTTTVYLEAFSNFAVSTMTAYGFIGARRRR